MNEADVRRLGIRLNTSEVAEQLRHWATVPSDWQAELDKLADSLDPPQPEAVGNVDWVPLKPEDLLGPLELVYPERFAQPMDVSTAVISADGIRLHLCRTNESFSICADGQEATTRAFKHYYARVKPISAPAPSPEPEPEKTRVVWPPVFDEPIEAPFHPELSETDRKKVACAAMLSGWTTCMAENKPHPNFGNVMLKLQEISGCWSVDCDKIAAYAKGL